MNRIRKEVKRKIINDKLILRFFKYFDKSLIVIIMILIRIKQSISTIAGYRGEDNMLTHPMN